VKLTYEHVKAVLRDDGAYLLPDAPPAPRAISTHRFDLLGDEGSKLGKLWLNIDHPASKRAFYLTWDEALDEVRVLEWNGDDCVAHPASELEPGIVEALRDFCRASDDIIELVNRYAREV
jgi:hypothetical protein